MTSKTHYPNAVRAARALWIAFLLLIFAQQVWADATQDTYRFSVSLESVDQLRFKFPVYDYDGSNADTWNEGTIYIQVAGGNKETVLKFLGKRTGTVPAAGELSALIVRDILQQELVRAEVLPPDYDFEAHKQLVAI